MSGRFKPLCCGLKLWAGIEGKEVSDSAEENWLENPTLRPRHAKLVLAGRVSSLKWKSMQGLFKDNTNPCAALG